MRGSHRLALLVLLAPLALPASPARAQEPLRIIAFGAHPDDCDIRSAESPPGGPRRATRCGSSPSPTATPGITKRAAGAGDAAPRRSHEAGRRIGVDYVVLDNHDGELVPTLDVRQQIIRQIREWKADLVLAPRPNDYHPDHRYTGVLVQDAAFMVTVPNVVPEVPALKKNPVFLYFEDDFQKPAPFRPDIAVSIDDVVDKKVDALDAHVSQFYEWLALARRHARPGAEGPGCPQGLVEEVADALAVTTGARGPDQVVWRRGRQQGAGGRGLRDLRVRQPAGRGDAAEAVPVLPGSVIACRARYARPARVSPVAGTIHIRLNPRGAMSPLPLFHGLRATVWVECRVRSQRDHSGTIAGHRSVAGHGRACAACQCHALADFGDRESFGGTGGPVDAHSHRAAPLAETKLQRRVLRGQVAAVGTHSTDLRRRASALDVHEGAEARAVGGAIVEPHLEPRGIGADAVPQQPHGSIVVGDQDVGVAVIVEVAEGRAAADLGTCEVPGRPGSRSRELSGAQIAEQLIPHPVRHRLPALGLDDVDGAVGDEQVQPAVVVVVDPVGAEPGERRRRLRQPAATRVSSNPPWPSLV